MSSLLKVREVEGKKHVVYHIGTMSEQGIRKVNHLLSHGWRLEHIGIEQEKAFNSLTYIKVVLAPVVDR